MSVDGGIYVFPQTPHPFADQQGQQHSAVLSPGEGLTLGGSPERIPVFPEKRQHQQNIYHLCRNGGNGGALCSQGREAQLAKNQQVVQPRIAHSGGNAGIEGIDGLLHAPQQRSQHGRADNGEEGQADDLQITPCLGNRLGVIDVQAHNGLGKQQANCGKNRRQNAAQTQIDIEAPADRSLVLLTEVLGNHDSRNGTDACHHHVEQHGEFSRQPHGGNGNRTHLPNHYLVYNAKGGLEHGLQRRWNRNGAHR